LRRVILWEGGSEFLQRQHVRRARNDPKSIITVAMKNAARAAKSVAIRRD